jgi:hypothetical protein
VAKAVIPREVAEVIECLTEELGIETIDVAWAVAERLLGNRIENAEINDRAQSIAKWIYATPGSMDVLMCALVNGYELERTPAEQLRELYGNKIVGDGRSKDFARGIRKTLEILEREYPELADVLGGCGNE